MNDIAQLCIFIEKEIINSGTSEQLLAKRDKRLFCKFYERMKETDEHHV